VQNLSELIEVPRSECVEVIANDFEGFAQIRRLRRARGKLQLETLAQIACTHARRLELVKVL
jgi:hypothetical protein